MTEQRFTLKIAQDSNDMWGWNGWVYDRLAKQHHPLIKTYIDYELQGEIGYGTCSFDTRAELLAAAKRKARKLAGRK